MAVADAFSAMTMDRPYRKGMRPGEALAILEQGAGTQWDPQCVQAFRRVCRMQSDRSFLSERLESVPSQSDTALFSEPSLVGLTGHSDNRVPGGRPKWPAAPA